MKIVFMGSAEFGLPALDMLLSRHDVAAVVSTPARPRGRGLKLFDSPVAEFAKTRGIDTILTPEDLLDGGFIRRLASFEPDLFVVVAFRILPKEVFSIPKFGTVNIHASLLPRYRGAAPIQRAIEAGERETGVTVFRIDGGVDTGGIILQKKLSIGGSETTPELYERLSAAGADALRESIDRLTSGNFSVIAQNSAEATRAPKLTRQEGHIDWKLPAAAIYNKIRAFKPFPGTYFFINGKRIGIEWGEPVQSSMILDDNSCQSGMTLNDNSHQSGIISDNNSYQSNRVSVNDSYQTNMVSTQKSHLSDTICPNQQKYMSGTVLSAKGGYIDVQCGGGVLRVSKVKPEGRPSMDVRAFLAGHTIAEGTVLE